MTPNDKQLTALARSMKKSLQAEHGVKVPHSALRASLLKGLGENPHGFAKREPKGSRTATPNPASQSAATRTPDAATDAPGLRTLYLVEDDTGCLAVLALDAAGRFKLPEWYDFEQAPLAGLQARVPSIRRYGLPDYLSDPTTFFAHFGLQLQREYKQAIEDSGDDSGDECRLSVAMPTAQWQHMLLALLSDPALHAEVVEWVGLNHHRVFEREPRAKRVEWVGRYIDSCEDAKAVDADYAEVIFEWVYPDEDGDSRKALVELSSGVITFVDGQEPSPQDITDSAVRTRVRLDDEEDDEIFDAKFRSDTHGGHWTLGAKALKELRQHLGS